MEPQCDEGPSGALLTAALGAISYMDKRMGGTTPRGFHLCLVWGLGRQDFFSYIGAFHRSRRTLSR